MHRLVLVRIDAPYAVTVAALEAVTGATVVDGTLDAACDEIPFEGSTLHATAERGAGDDDRDGDASTQLRLEARTPVDVPFFGPFVELQAYVAARRAVRITVAGIRAHVAGVPAPPPPHRWPIVPPTRFTMDQARRLAALASAAVLANFAGGLLTQNGDAVARSFDRSDEALGAALAIARVGVLVSLVVIALADRLGRRRLILAALIGCSAANLLGAIAPSFELFTASQLLTRAFATGALVVAGIAVVEESPEGARAFSTAMFGLALGIGIGLSVIVLPLADLGDDGWRIAFALSAALVVFVPVIARRLDETRRYADLIRTQVHRGRLAEVFGGEHRRRFLLLGAVAFMTSVFSAPSSQLTNRYLTDAHDFSNADVALFRAITLGVPGIIGVLLAGRLAETRGRRPVTIVGLLVASAAQMLFFVAGADALLWIAPVVAVIAAACAGLAIGTLDAELFPTEVRGTSNGFLLVTGVAGSAVGLLAATQLRDVLGGLGPAIALCGFATILAAVLIVPRLPETVERRLDEISPTEP